MEGISATWALVFRGPFDERQYKEVLQFVEDYTELKLIYQKVSPAYLKIVEEDKETFERGKSHESRG